MEAAFPDVHEFYFIFEYTCILYTVVDTQHFFQGSLGCSYLTYEFRNVYYHRVLIRNVLVRNMLLD
jgi:hypothetical protein